MQFVSIINESTQKLQDLEKYPKLPIYSCNQLDLLYGLFAFYFVAVLRETFGAGKS